MTTIEIKIKMLDNFEMWENLPSSEVSLPKLDEATVINEAAKIVDVAKIREIRWNYPASCQGHYVPVNTKFNIRFQQLGDIVDAIEALENE